MLGFGIDSFDFGTQILIVLFMVVWGLGWIAKKAASAPGVQRGVFDSIFKLFK